MRNIELCKFIQKCFLFREGRGTTTISFSNDDKPSKLYCFYEERIYGISYLCLNVVRNVLLRVLFSVGLVVVIFLISCLKGLLSLASYSL